MLFLQLFLLTIPLVLAIASLTLMLIFIFGPPFVPTPMPVIKYLIKIAKIGKNDLVVDLGSGDGRMLVEAAREGAKAQGWEINPFLVIYTKLYALRYGVGDQVKIYLKSYTTADLKEATIVFLYNLPKYMPKLEQIMKRDLKKGSRILTYKFQLTTIKPTSNPKPNIFVYII